MKHYIAIVLLGSLLSLFSSCSSEIAQDIDPKIVLEDSLQREQIFGVIMNDHQLMTEFVDKMLNHEHASSMLFNHEGIVDGITSHSGVMSGLMSREKGLLEMIMNSMEEDSVTCQRIGDILMSDDHMQMKVIEMMNKQTMKGRLGDSIVTHNMWHEQHVGMGRE
jgi:hypothetical protein